MIQIDDAGSGSLVGGTCIGIYRPETKQFKYDIIPLEYYTKDNTDKKEYLNYVVSIVKNVFIDLEVQKHEPIEICRGYMFDQLRKWLKTNNYVWENTVIIGELQNHVERCFEDYTISLGFPKAFIQYTKYPFHFHRILKWVYADYENRSKLVKQGWKSWLRYKDLPVEISFQMQDMFQHLYCYKCGKPIKYGREMKVIKYNTVKTNIIYVHSDC